MRYSFTNKSMDLCRICFFATGHGSWSFVRGRVLHHVGIQAPCQWQWQRYRCREPEKAQGLSTVSLRPKCRREERSRRRANSIGKQHVTRVSSAARLAYRLSENETCGHCTMLARLFFVLGACCLCLFGVSHLTRRLHSKGFDSNMLVKYTHSFSFT
jgi:hypothetical protein